MRVVMTSVALVLGFTLRAPEPEDEHVDITVLPAEWAGIYIVDLETGLPFFEQNADGRYIPASVTKAVTSASVVMLRDTDATFTTRVELTGRQVGDTLRGDLVIRTVGDPTLGSWRFEQTKGFTDSIVKALKRRGIRGIAGSVKVDTTAMRDATVPPGWARNDLNYAYGAPLRSSTWNHNVVSREDSRGRKMTLVDMRPDTTLAATVKRRLKASDIGVAGRSTVAATQTTLLYEHHSLRYADILRDLMHRSDNLFAEGMLRTLAEGESRAEALGEERDLWEDPEWGLDMTGTELYDGSGLSRRNRMTPRFLTTLLQTMANSGMAESYVALFPKAGRQGTVKNLLKGTPLEGRMVLKSGSMTGVQCYAGYLLDATGRPTHAVTVMVNDFTIARPNLKKDIERMFLDLFIGPERIEEEIE